MSTHRQLTVGILWQNDRPVPQIRLAGRWLAEHGFQAGDNIRVTAEAGSLRLEIVAPEGK